MTRSLTWRELQASTHDLEAPFVLVLDDGSFTVVEILRHLPGRRLTAGVSDSARGEGVLKLFFGGRATRDWQRARRGQQAFQQAGVRTTPVVTEKPGVAPWLLFARLPGTRHADAADSEQLADILGRLHHAGYSHTDLHVGNFLRDPDGFIHCIDGDAIVPRVTSVDGGLSELAILLAQFPVSARPDVAASLAAYLMERQVEPGSHLTTRLNDLLRTAMHRRVRHYLAKAMRDCTNFVTGRVASSRTVARRESAALFDQFAANPEHWFRADGSALKRGNSATVVRLVIGGVTLVAKRYNITGTQHRLRRIFKRRGKDAWLNGLRLEFLGIPTAKPLGLVETGPRWWPGPSYVLMEHLGGRDLATLTSTGAIDRFTLKELCEIVDWFRLAGLSHGDFKSTNFLLHEGRLRVIDVDAVDVGAQQADIERLLANWPLESQVHKAVREGLLAAGIRVDAH